MRHQPADVKAVVMVGGSTRSNHVQTRVSDFFGQDVLTGVDPDKVVAYGAAIQAAALSGNHAAGDMLLLDVAPLSLGIENHRHPLGITLGCVRHQPPSVEYRLS